MNPSNLPNIENSYNRLNFQFDVEARLCSLFLEQGEYHGFDGSEQVCYFCTSFSVLVDLQNFFLNMAGFTDLVETEQRRNVWGCFCRSLHSDGKPHTIALKNRIYYYIRYLQFLLEVKHLCSPWNPSNLPNMENSYNRLNFQFDVEARLCSLFSWTRRISRIWWQWAGLLFLHFFFSAGRSSEFLS